MRVFLAVASLKASYGGPAYSVARLSAGLAEAGIGVALWARDQSSLEVHAVESTSSVTRLCGPVTQALASFENVDVVHDNGLWLAHNHQLARACSERRIARVVSIRGMLEPWAINHKKWKKRIAWWLYQHRDLRMAGFHHASADLEARNLEALRLGVPICVIPNGVEIPSADFAHLCRDIDNARPVRTALFLGRLYPVKGLPMLIRAWERVRPKGWVLKIAGPDEAGHRAQLMAEVVSAGLQDVITFPGALAGDDKRAAFCRADLFVLSSHSESFGMAIAEALAHGLPVLTTTGTPWHSLEKRGCGWSVQPTIEGITEGLRRATALDAAALQAMGLRGRDFVANEFGWGSVVKSFITLYEDLLRRRAT